MKMQKKLTVVLAILIVVLVSLVSFGGIFYKSKNEMKNLVPDYKLGTDLKGYRQIVLEPKTEPEIETQEVADSSEEQSEGENVTEESKNTEDNKEDESVYNKENYKKAAEIFKNRLKTLKIDTYSVACDEETGKIEINLPENLQTDVILSDFTQKGEFSIKDSKTEEALLTNSDVRNVKVGNNVSAEGSSTTYMSIYLTTKGTNKFADITKNYQNTVEENTTNGENENNNQTSTEEGNTVDENAVTSENTTSDENTTAEENASDNSNDNTPSTEVTLNIDDVTMLTTSFDAIIDNGVLSLTLGASEEQTEEELYSAYNLAAIIENEPLPMEYEVQGNVYVSSIIEEKQIKTIIYIEIGIALAIILALIIKFRIKGLMAGILSVGYLAIMLMVSRYANVVISILGIFAIEISFILNIIYSFIKFNRLGEEKLTVKEENKIRKKAMIDYVLVLIPTLIIAVVCLFTQWSQLLSLGMIMFWGITISIVYNYIMDKLVG